MVIRFFVAVTATVLLFPYLAMWSLSLAQPGTVFAVDADTWRVGLFPIALGWLVFLSPAIIPGISGRYLPWVARITGLMVVGETFRTCGRRIALFLGRAATQTRTLLQGLQSRPALSTPLSVASALDPGQPLPASDYDVPARQAHSGTNIPAGARLRSGLDNARRRLANLSADRDAHLETARSTLRSFRDRVAAYGPVSGLVPSELNAYTLETLAHLKQIARLASRSFDLAAADAKFVEAVFSAIPQPLLPGEDDHPVPEPLIYPENLRQELLTSAGHCRAVLSEEDIVRAAEGDLERGLKVALAVLQVADHRRRRAIDRASADPLLVLPQHNPAEPLEDQKLAESGAN